MKYTVFGDLMELVNTILSGYVMPVLLMSCGVIFGAQVRFFYIFHPIRVTKVLLNGAKKGGVSPFRALSQALAGTLGVGNMTGVATAICAGGAGAIFWMWISALLAMSVKYFEVALSQQCRRRSDEGFYGGAMYYIKDIFSRYFPNAASLFGGIFAIFCIANSLLTGNIVQMNSAAAVFPSLSPVVLGVFCAAFVIPVVIGKGKRVSAVTMGLIPFLSALYVILSFLIIVPSAHRLPAVLSEIIRGAFSFKSVGGGVGGFLIMRAIRFGTTRGIFSNEAGSGTSPTAHAEANAKSPHSQGCFGIFEVFADTILLCTLTAFVILLSDGCALGYNGIALTLYAFSSQAGAFAGWLVGISVILFAYATVICQTRYAVVALRYVTKSRTAFFVYICAVALSCIFGTVINEDVMWQGADFCISLMTALNVLCLGVAAKQGRLRKIYDNGEDSDENK
ncbi:MAG: sodium:alanine symporter family protein [Ruminococcaceae bacterium]|nr:sodium:alanine symporter family protein [Oscillospiraceae bacterium]